MTKIVHVFYYYFATQNKLQQVITHNKEVNDIKLTLN